MEIDINGNFIQHQLYEPPVKTGYEAWRISYQSSEQAARAAFNEVSALTTERNELRARLLQKMDDCVKAEKQNEQLRQRVAELENERLEQQEKLCGCIVNLGQLRAERDEATQYWQIAEGRCDALVKQRDELLAAMYLITKRPVIEAFSIAEAAIASVKEKA